MITRAEAELFNLITRTDLPHQDHLLFSSRNALTKAILAAGWREPARTVSTVEDLETVLAGALLFSPRTNNVWWRRTNRPRLRWTGSGGDFTFDEDFIRLEGPLTVIHEGGA
jgi:hypothetical protein